MFDGFGVVGALGSALARGSEDFEGAQHPAQNWVVAEDGFGL